MATQLGSMALMSIVKIKENGIQQEFHVIRHNAYTTGRTLLLRRYTHSRRQWHNPNVNAYATCALDAWFNGEYFNTLPADIRGQIAAVTIPYTTGNGNAGLSNLTRKIFALSATELGQTRNQLNVEGAALANASALTSATNSGGVGEIQWTRSPVTTHDYLVWGLYSDGFMNSCNCTDNCAARPAFTLPYSLLVTDDGFVVTNISPNAPTSISIPNNISGGVTITVSWGAATDPDGNLAGYIVERSTDGGSTWNEIYRGGSTSTSNTVAYGTPSVMYRVKAYDSEGLQSGYKTSSYVTVFNNVAPTVPSSIDVPATVNGGKSLYISWGSASDSDGNLSGYQLERSVSGGAWAQIYQGMAYSYTDGITYGWQSVQYRVRAYDSAGAVSGYATSSVRYVNNNSAPTAPPSITVPEMRGGKPCTILWGSATDVDGNLAGYRLERNVSGGSWTQIYDGPNRSYNDQITRGWTIVSYRVCAYDAEGAVSGYATGPTQTVINNASPLISGTDTNLGQKDTDFSVSYSVSDDDGDPITITEALDGQVLRTFSATANAQNTLLIDAVRFQQIINGSHTITVTAADDHGGRSVRTWTFSKNIAILSISRKQPYPADAAAQRCTLTVMYEIPVGANFKAEVCNNAFDTEPTWEDCTMAVQEGRKCFFTNTVKTAEQWGFNYRISANRLGTTGPCRINLEVRGAFD